MTPQVTKKVAVAPDGKLGPICKPALCSAVMVGLVGQILAALAVQVTAVQFKPGAAGSVSTVPAASDGPWLPTTMVYVVVWPAVTPTRPLDLLTVSNAEPCKRTSSAVDEPEL